MKKYYIEREVRQGTFLQAETPDEARQKALEVNDGEKWEIPSDAEWGRIVGVYSVDAEGLLTIELEG